MFVVASVADCTGIVSVAPLAIDGPAIHVESAAVVLYLGLFQVGLAYICLTRSIRHVPALQAAAILLIEPVLNPLWAWLIHGERPSGMALAGGALIVAAALGGSLWQAKRATAELA